MICRCAFCELPICEKRHDLIIVNLRINWTLQTGGVRKTKLPFYRLVGTVSNCAYSVRLETAPTGGAKVPIYF